MSESVIYTCPMHPEVISDKPGACPKCGMALEPKEPVAKGPGETEEKNPELENMSRRFWVCLWLTLPLAATAMIERA